MGIAAALAFLVVPAIGTASPQVEVSPSDARLLTELIVSAASSDGRLAVLSSNDVRAAIDLEAQRAITGCDETSCMKEIAGALAADYVVHGNIGALGNKLILTLNLFDTKKGFSAGRALARADSLEALGDKVPGIVGELLKTVPALPADQPADNKPRALVVDLKRTGPEPEPAADSASATSAVVEGDAGSLLTAVGVGSLALGTVALGGAIGVEVWAASDAAALDEGSATQKAAQAAQETRENVQRPIALGCYAAAVVAGIAGGILFALGAAE